MKKSTTLSGIKPGAEFYLAVTPWYDEDANTPNGWDGIYGAELTALAQLKDISIKEETDGYLYRCIPITKVHTYRHQQVSAGQDNIFVRTYKGFLTWWRRHW